MDMVSLRALPHSVYQVHEKVPFQLEDSALILRDLSLKFLVKFRIVELRSVCMLIGEWGLAASGVWKRQLHLSSRIGGSERFTFYSISPDPEYSCYVFAGRGE
jgi:hypothetical protein